MTRFLWVQQMGMKQSRNMSRIRTVRNGPPQLLHSPLVGRVPTTFRDSSHTRQHTMVTYAS
jgi:hypothetical protein